MKINSSSISYELATLLVTNGKLFKEIDYETAVRFAFSSLMNNWSDNYMYDDTDITSLADVQELCFENAGNKVFYSQGCEAVQMFYEFADKVSLEPDNSYCVVLDAENEEYNCVEIYNFKGATVVIVSNTCGDDSSEIFFYEHQ